MSAISREGTSAWLANIGYSQLADAVMNEERFPSEQTEHIQNNSVHLCDSCQHTFPLCPSHDSDVIFGDGKGNDNICVCNKYRPALNRVLEAPTIEPGRKVGRWIDHSDDGYVECPFCGSATNCDDNVNELHYCFSCGAKME